MLGGGVSFFSHSCFAHVLANKLPCMLTLATIIELSGPPNQTKPIKVEEGACWEEERIQ